jgi:hypothetical protein
MQQDSSRIVINGSITKPESRNSLCSLMIGLFISSGVQLDIIKWVVSDIISLPKIHRDREQIKQHVFQLQRQFEIYDMDFCMLCVFRGNKFRF